MNLILQQLSIAPYDFPSNKYIFAVIPSDHAFRTTYQILFEGEI